ncbi:hypothetical protein AB0K40_18030 [Nonomuraea bangladeshensis]|uniref:SWIM-type domain-containing protein n=1 Tax=Nonomuraea bangladeshensis TaxID=404385 RepID=A0ABV3H4F4_9ACTN
MTRLRRTTTSPLGTPIAGDLIKDDLDNPLVPLTLGPDLELLIDDPRWAHDLMASAGVVASVLDSALGLPAPAGPRCSCDEDPLQCAHQARLGEAEDDRDAFRALLARMVSVRTYQELQVVAEEARRALDRYDRRGADSTEQGEAVVSP